MKTEIYQPSYVYQITHNPSGIKYIGSRWSSVLTNSNIYDDLGSVYFSNSTSELFSREYQQLRPEEYIYNVLRIFNTPYEAQLCEEVLHEYFDVARSRNFANKYKAKACKYNYPYLDKGQCVVYNILTEKHEVIFVDDMKEYHRHQAVGTRPVRNIYTNKRKRVNVEEKIGDEWVAITKGFKVVKNINTKETKLVELEDALSDEWVHINHGTVNIIDKDGIHRKITCEEYKKGNYRTKTAGKITARNKHDLNWSLLDVSSYDSNLHETPTTGRVTVYNNSLQKTESVRIDDPRLETGEVEKLVAVKGDKRWVTQSEYKTGKYESILSGVAALTKDGNTITVPVEEVPLYKEKGWRGIGSLSVFTDESFRKRRKTLQKIDETGRSGYDKRSENYSKTVNSVGDDGLTLAQKRSIKIAETRKKKLGKLNLFDSENNLIDTDYLMDLSKKYNIPRHCLDKCISDGKGFFSNRPNVAKKRGLERILCWRVEKA